MGTNHGRTGFEIRGNIYVIKNGGLERLAWTYGINQAGNLLDCNFYAGRSTTITPASSADFVKFDGTSGDDLLFADTSTDNKNHDMQGLLCQNESTEDLFFVFGHLDADQALGGSGTRFDIKAIRLTKSGSNWTTGSVVVICANGSVIPHLLDTDSASDKAWVMYNHASLGINFGYFNTSGTWVNEAITSPLTTANRAAFGTFTAGDDGKIWAIYENFGTYNGGSPTMAGGIGYWNGSSWNITTIGTPVQCTSISGVANWDNGCLAIRFDGDPVAQTVSGISLASVRGT
jgi:hypothetical protein